MPEKFSHDWERVEETRRKLATLDKLQTTTDDSPATEVNHPKHYNSHPSGIECIEIVRHHNFNTGNAIKYLWRAGLKDGEADVKDLKKAIWYLQDEVKRLENS